VGTEGKTEATETRYLPPLLAISPRDETRNIIIMIRVTDGRDQEYQREWHIHVERMPLNICHGRRIVIILVEKGRRRR
jgi:hypothetical protein